jgi:hypothetical protein
MKFQNYLNILYRKAIITYSKRKINKFNTKFKISDIHSKKLSRNDVYDYFHHYYWNIAPIWLREHRNYFQENKRGFGEDAFHAMWLNLFEEFKPINILEIGVYRGQTISLFQLISNMFKINCEIHCISPFSSAGDEVSIYLKSIDYLEDVKINFDHFKLKYPKFHKGFSTENEMLEIIASKKWDLIYIDGNHDYEIVKIDFNNCAKALNENGIIVLDDSSMWTSYKPKLYSTAGHPGPSKIANQIDLNNFTEILAVGHNRAFQKK